MDLFSKNVKAQMERGTMSLDLRSGTPVARETRPTIVVYEANTHPQEFQSITLDLVKTPDDFQREVLKALNRKGQVEIHSNFIRVEQGKEADFPRNLSPGALYAVTIYPTIWITVVPLFKDGLVMDDRVEHKLTLDVSENLMIGGLRLKILNLMRENGIRCPREDKNAKNKQQREAHVHHLVLFHKPEGPGNYPIMNNDMRIRDYKAKPRTGEGKEMTVLTGWKDAPRDVLKTVKDEDWFSYYPLANIKPVGAPEEWGEEQQGDKMECD